MITFIFIVSSLIPITIGLIQWVHFTGDSIDCTNTGNKYNKYRIYSRGRKYFCKMVTGYIFGIIPVWIKVKYYYNTGFNMTTRLWVEKDLDIMIQDMEFGHAQYLKSHPMFPKRTVLVYESKGK